MTKAIMVVFPVLFLTILTNQIVHAGIRRPDIPGRLPTRLSSAEIAREGLDEQLYPNFMKFLKTVGVSRGIYKTDSRNRKWIKSSHFYTPGAEVWDEFFLAASKDRLTCLRAFALLGREIKKSGVVIFGPSKFFEKAVERNKVDLGLALPARNLGAAVWSPDPTNKDPEFQIHIKIFYTESFVHQFPDEILPANLKIGYTDPESYWLDGKEYKQPAMDADVYYGPVHGIGFRNVKGVGGQKRGVLGFFQKVLFFLPDAVNSMTIDENKGEMVTEALVNTSVKEFEKNPIYAIKIQKQ